MDFQQHGPITTLHDLTGSTRDCHRLATRLLGEQGGASLVLPMHAHRVSRSQLKRLRVALSKAPPLERVVIPLLAPNALAAKRVQSEFAHESRFEVIWCEDPSFEPIVDRFQQRGLPLPAERGKGFALWLGIGLASEISPHIVVHDSDVDELFPHDIARLLIPLLHPKIRADFVKGYCTRLTKNRLHARLTRLHFWPLLDALATIQRSASPTLAYLRCFRAPLSGEMALTRDLARRVRIPHDWSAEMALLLEVEREVAPRNVVQTSLNTQRRRLHPRHDVHGRGLTRMAHDITRTLLTMLAAQEGFCLEEGTETTLLVAYRRHAQEAIRAYHADSLANGIPYDRHDEELLIETFEVHIRAACRSYALGGQNHPLPDWHRVIKADGQAMKRFGSGRPEDALATTAQGEHPLEAVTEG